jgi:uncharacterized protein with von Willebrand factor type A (vWA) domain
VVVAKALLLVDNNTDIDDFVSEMENIYKHRFPKFRALFYYFSIYLVWPQV